MHPFAWLLSERLLPADQTGSTRLFAGLALTIAVATLTQRCIERPAIAFGRRLSAKYAAARAAPSA